MMMMMMMMMIIGHPVADQSDIVAEASHRIRVITGWRADVNLCVGPAESANLRQTSVSVADKFY